jgi:hypothetical protein
MSGSPLRMPHESWPRNGDERRVAIEARAVRGGACTLLLLRDAAGVRLLFHAAESTGVQLSHDVHQDLMEALQRIAE